MKRFLLAPLILALGAMCAFAQGTYTENLTVTNSPTPIVIHNGSTFVLIRENAATPTAVFSVTPAAANSVAVNLAAGQAYQFSNGSFPYASGTTLGTIQATTAGPFTFVIFEMSAFQAFPSASIMAAAGGSSTANQGTAAAASGAWPTKVTDGTNIAAVKPASTAAQAADSAIVVAESPNTPLPPGSNLIGKTGFDNTTPGTTNGVSMAQPSRTTGTITTSASTVSVSSAGYSIATVTTNGTYAGITVNFEFSDDGGTTWYSDTCARTDTNVLESSEALPSNQTRAWDCSIYAATTFRVRSSAYTSGTANIGITLSAAPVESAPTVQMASGFTQPVSASSLPLPTGASTSAKQPALGTAGSPAADVITVQGAASMTAVKVDGSAVTQPVSASSLPLPTGAATSAKQPALGTAGTPSADVISVQGATSMTPVKVDGSGVTQPVSGTVTANAGTGTMGVQGATASGSAESNDNPVMQGGSDGTNIQKSLTASASNMGGTLTTTEKGARLMEKGPRWSVSSAPAAGSQATASKSAGGAGVRHILDCISFSAGSTSAPALTQLSINVRDGASGGGSVIWQHTVIIPAATGQNVSPFGLCGLGLVGSSNTAMTIEFSASLANLFESVDISGTDVN